MQLYILLNLMFLLVCMNSDELTGFDLSHNGYWFHGKTYQGTKTVMECALSCLQDCVAIDATPSKCSHYKNKTDLVNANVRYDSGLKAYIKCAGTFKMKFNI